MADTNGEIQVVEIDDEEALTPAARSLVALMYEVTDSINQRLWPSLETIPSGITVDTRLCDEVIDLIVSFFDDRDWDITEIRKSMISEELIRVDLYDFPSRLWVEVYHDGHGWKMLRFLEGWWLWQPNDWAWQEV